MTEHLVAVFKNAADGAAAERDLQQLGIPPEQIRRYSGSSLATHAAGGESAYGETAQPSGFWAWLLGEESGARADWRSDAGSFDRRVAAGDTVLSVTLTDDSQIHNAVAALEAHNPIGIDETTEEAAAGAPSAGAPRASSAEARATVSHGGEEVIPLAKEEIEIAKRAVDRGATRVRRYVVETPVERDVTLRGERVTIERRSPTGVAGPSGGQFEERVVEVHETDEVPVVQKTAHVDEEVVIHREATERTEKVRDTVRREEVEITPNTTTPGNPR
jgi:uncharacterized protein (TIGR02271 family)